jgi:hypothetical protein
MLGAGFFFGDHMSEGRVEEPSKERRDKKLSARRKVLDEIFEEMEYQDKRWGQDHDKKHTPEEWHVILTIYLGKLAQETPMFQGGANYDRAKFQKRLRQIGAIAAAAHAALSVTST